MISFDKSELIGEPLPLVASRLIMFQTERIWVNYPNNPGGSGISSNLFDPGWGVLSTV